MSSFYIVYCEKGNVEAFQVRRAPRTTNIPNPQAAELEAVVPMAFAEAARQFYSMWNTWTRVLCDEHALVPSLRDRDLEATVKVSLHDMATRVVVFLFKIHRSMMATYDGKQLRSSHLLSYIAYVINEVAFKDSYPRNSRTVAEWNKWVGEIRTMGTFSFGESRWFFHRCTL